MGLSLRHLKPDQVYEFTAVVNQTGMGHRTERPTRMLFALETGDVYEEHTWLTYDEDVCRFKYRTFGDTISFTAMTYLYDGNKMGIRHLEHLKHIGKVDLKEIMHMCTVKDKSERHKAHPRKVCTECGEEIKATAMMYYGFGKKGTELYFDLPDHRAAYMERVFG